MKMNNRGIFGRLAIIAATVVVSSIHALASQTWYVNVVTGSDANNGRATGSAFASIQKAIDSSSWGDRILVSDGIYGPIVTTNQLLTIESVNGADKTVIDGGYPDSNNIAARFGDSTNNGTNTVLRGFTVRNGYATYGGGIMYGTAEHCVISNNTAAAYGGGTISCNCNDCLITCNTAGYYGGGFAYGTAKRCIITSNTAYCGGAVYNANVYNCLITFNTVDGGGGGAYSSSLHHCTLYGNTAEQGGGAYNCDAVNCIFSENTATADRTGDDTCYVAVSYSCASKNANLQGDGAGNISSDPRFANVAAGDFRLHKDSPCIDAGTIADDVDAEGPDLDGNMRIRGEQTDMGAYEAAVAGASVVVTDMAGGCVSPLTAAFGSGGSATFTAFGPRSFTGFWTNGVFATSEKVFTVRDVSGDISLSARFDLSGGNVEIYASANPKGEFANGIVTADAMSLQTAINASIDGDTILAEEGVYTPIVSKNKSILIQSINGVEATVIDGGGTNCCAELGGSVSQLSTRLKGFTLRNGLATGGGGGSFAGTVEDCIITNCSAQTGGGAYGGKLKNCIISQNSASSGGGVAKATLEGCSLRDNVATSGRGGGATASTLYDTTIENNRAYRSGGGTDSGTSTRCIYKNNSAPNGGGANGGILKNCLMTGNTATSVGGAAYGDCDTETISLVNCTIVGNAAGVAGGGVYSNTAENYATDDEGDMCNCVCIANSILWGNKLTTGEESNYASSDSLGGGILFGNSVAFPLPSGENNISDDPLFVDASKGDYRLMDVSPCIDAGGNSYATTTVQGYYVGDAYGTVAYFSSSKTEAVDVTTPDLGGNQRLMFGGLDIGAYECQTKFTPEEQITYKDVWGEWSNEGEEAYSVPESVATWDELSRVLWQSRDAYVKGGANTEVPPSEGSVVLSLGAVRVPDSLMNGEEDIATEIENGVPVWRLRVYEDAENSSLVAVVGRSVFALSSIPVYLGNSWVEAVYGTPPTWLNAEEREKWYASRSRCRIEWFVTLVPQSQWATFCANRAMTAADAVENKESPLVINAVASDAETGIHSVSVRSIADGETRIWGKDSLTETNWTYKGFSLQSAGTTAAGAYSVSNQLFMMATFSEISYDSDGDGIPDIMEQKVYGTNPYKADSSGDGLTDWEKVFHYDLNPRVRDTAGDGVSDDEKILSGADPRVPLTSEQQAAASRSIRYTYDDDDRLTGTWLGLGGSSIKTKLTPAGNPVEINNRDTSTEPTQVTEPVVPTALSISGPDSISAGEAATYTSTVTRSDATFGTVTPIWELISGSSYASISSSGLLTSNSIDAQQDVTIKASYTQNDTTVIATKRVTITVVPVTVNITVSFDGNGGTPSESSKVYAANTAYGSLPTATCSGQEFAGWWTDANGGSQIIESSIVPAANTTLFAHWTPITPVVTVQPPSLTISASPTEVSATWTSSANAVRYELYRGTDADFSHATKIVSVDGLTYKDSPELAGNTAYYYWVKAIGSSAESSESNVSHVHTYQTAGSYALTLPAGDHEVALVGGGGGGAQCALL